MRETSDPTIAVIGLGKLGTPLLAVLSQHFKVVGVERNTQVLATLEQGKSAYYETGVDTLLTQYRANYSLTSQMDVALKTSAIVFIVVPTPSNEDGTFDCSHIITVCEQIGRSSALTPNHLIVIASTVMPSQIESRIIPALQCSGKKMGHDFALCYNPFFIALGSVVANIQSPDMILIGECNKADGDRLERLYATLCTNTPPFKRMNFITAEITKLALNTFVTTKISYANMIARLCEKLPGADSGMVLSSIGVDRRIGSSCLQGAIGYGGPCFPRDNLALSAVAHAAQADTSIIESVHTFNERQPEYVLALIAQYVSSMDRVGMLGVTYKPDTHSIEHSQAWDVLLRLSHTCAAAGFYDPQAIVPDTPSSIRRFANAEECMQNSTAIIIGTPWKELRDITTTLNNSAVKCVIDFWNILTPHQLRNDIRLIALGKGMT